MKIIFGHDIDHTASTNSTSREPWNIYWNENSDSTIKNCTEEKSNK